MSVGEPLQLVGARLKIFGVKMNLGLRLFVASVAIMMFGCTDIRPENLDKSQREAVNSQMRTSHSDAKSTSDKDGAILRVVDKKDFFDKTTIVSSLVSVKDGSGHQQLGLMNGLIKKSILNLDPGTYTIFITCSLPPIYNNHRLQVNLPAGSDSTLFCMPKAGGKLLGLNTISAFYVFLADSNKFEDVQVQVRQEIEKGEASLSCGSNCRELPLD